MPLAIPHHRGSAVRAPPGPTLFRVGSGPRVASSGLLAEPNCVTRGDAGTRQFNVSEIGGNALAGGLSNLYYPAADRLLANTLKRWGTQVMWDTLSNTLKEFWPDIRKHIRKH